MAALYKKRTQRACAQACDRPRGLVRRRAVCAAGVMCIAKRECVWYSDCALGKKGRLARGLAECAA